MPSPTRLTGTPGVGKGFGGVLGGRVWGSRRGFGRLGGFWHPWGTVLATFGKDSGPQAALGAFGSPGDCFGPFSEGFWATVQPRLVSSRLWRLSREAQPRGAENRHCRCLSRDAARRTGLRTQRLSSSSACLCCCSGQPFREVDTLEVWIQQHYRGFFSVHLRC